jgi:hypothetical protein
MPRMVKQTLVLTSKNRLRAVWKITALIECPYGGPPVKEYYLVAAPDGYAATAALRKKFSYLLDTQCDVIGEAAPAFLDWLDFRDNKVYRVMAETYDIPPKRTNAPNNQLVKSIIDNATARKPHRDAAPEEQGNDAAAVSAAGDELD